MKRVRAWWQSVIHPPRQRPWYFVIYLVIAATGVVTILQPPVTIEAEFGPALTFVWALLIAVGGFLGACMVLTRFWAMERAALGWIFTGLSMYAVVVFMQHIGTSGSRLTQLGVILALLLMLAKRYQTIHGWTIAPPHLDS